MWLKEERGWGMGLVIKTNVDKVESFRFYSGSEWYLDYQSSFKIIFVSFNWVLESREDLTKEFS